MNILIPLVVAQTTIMTPLTHLDCYFNEVTAEMVCPPIPSGEKFVREEPKKKKKKLRCMGYRSYNAKKGTYLSYDRKIKPCR